MKKSSFNLGWRVKAGISQPFDAVFAGGISEGTPVMLPQDAMILEPRDPHCPGQNQVGYYPAKTYTYTKEFDASDLGGKTSILEFEGVMAKALVYLNNEFMACHKYGYSSFFVDLKKYLRPGKNTLKVVAVNQELASRWYPGSGIYRDVNLWQGGRQYFVPDGLRLTTTAAQGNQASVTVEYEMVNTEATEQEVNVTLEIRDGVQVIAAKTACHRLNKKEIGHRTLELNPVHLWSPDDPHLLTVCLTMASQDGFIRDQHTETVGIRHLSISAEKGLCVNGETVKLRGACIHHDHGILGATDLYAAEEFKLKKLKEAGFNSIRSAHNPASKALLAACDRLGILVMDELTDMWREQKNMNDFALDFIDTWQDEVNRLVRKDYNHACVVLYSTGNEIPEIGRTSGHEMNKMLVDALHRLDSTRPVTNAISGFLAIADHTGEFASQQEVPRPGEQEEKAPQGGGSEQMNAMAGDIEKQMMDAFSVNPVLSRCIQPVEEACDVAGYNYLTARHAFVHGEHPDWVVVGSETYPTEIAELWRIVEKHPHVIGDFTWTGYDYLGEAGIGVFHYDSDRKDQGWFPDRVAYCGDINLNGYRRPVSYLREIAYGLRKKPYLFVKRVDRVGHTHDKNRWKYHDGIHSWTFPGYEGVKTLAYVLTSDPEAELFLNGVSLGKKKVGEQEGLTAIFEVPYEPGTLTVRTAGGEDTLVTAGTPAALRVESSKATLKKGGRDVCFITADLVDANGVASKGKKAFYPFGWGLSYTAFAENVQSVEYRAGKGVRVVLQVKNTGSVPGKHVVQLYISKPLRALIAFGKTKTLAPGEAETLTLFAEERNLDTFSEKEQAYRIEAGTYTLYLGENAEQVREIGVFEIKETIVTRKTLVHMTGKRLIPGYSDEPLFPGVEEMPVKDLIRLSVCAGDGWGMEGTGEAGRVAKVGSIDLPDFVVADGNSGVNMKQKNIGMPSGGTYAASFNPALLYDIGRVIGEEAKELGISMILGPGFNLQRNPLCGRNPEYFSEDPFLAGTLAAAFAKGLESTGVKGCYKHLVANNAEASRKRNDSVMDENTLRNLYLRAFEIALRAYEPAAVMTSYNLINGCWTSNDPELVLGVLRQEWGFRGFVMTDWGSYLTADTVQMVNSGISWITPCSSDDTFTAPLEQAAKEGRLDVRRLRENVSYMLKTFITQTSHIGNSLRILKIL